MISCSEKQATNVTVFFPSKSGKEATRSFEQIIIPDGANGDANIPAYDPTMDTPVHTITNNNVGLIKLSSKITIDDSKEICRRKNSKKNLTKFSLNRNSQDTNLSRGIRSSGCLFIYKSRSEI